MKLNIEQPNHFQNQTLFELFFTQICRNFGLFGLYWDGMFAQCTRFGSSNFTSGVQDYKASNCSKLLSKCDEICPSASTHLELFVYHDIPLGTICSTFYYSSSVHESNLISILNTQLANNSKWELEIQLNQAKSHCTDKKFCKNTKAGKTLIVQKF